MSQILFMNYNKTPKPKRYIYFENKTSLVRVKFIHYCNRE